MLRISTLSILFFSAAQLFHNSKKTNDLEILLNRLKIKHHLKTKKNHNPNESKI